LRERHETLEQLAPRLGFNDVYYFSRWFRQQMGMTPGEYRRRSRALMI
jgi:AraC-like DNA-binding protein